MTTQAKQRRAHYIRSTTSVTFVILATSLYAPTLAQDTSQNPTVEKCRLIQSASTRLRCYDELFAVTPEPNIITTPTSPIVTTVPNVNLDNSSAKDTVASATPKPILTDNNKLTQSVEEFRATKLPDSQKEVLQTVSVEILRTKEFGYRKTRFYLKNGQVWEQLDTNRVRIPKIKEGNPNIAEIKKASFGSHDLRINGKGKAIRVRRTK